MITTLYEPFRHWSDGGNVWIISDTHFDDPDCKLMDSEWISPKEHVKIINHYVKKNDCIIHLGDVGNPRYIKWMDGRYHVLLLGNHDHNASYYKDFFDEIYSGPLFIAQKILLSHEPVYGLPWCLNIHGHDHNGMEEYSEGCKHINLAANVCGYTPVSLKDLLREGAMAGIGSIHRITIDRAVEKKAAKEADAK